jgi:antitoxin Phd
MMMKRWQLQEAKARFSEFLDACIKDGPQVVTRRGTPEAVLVPMPQWERLQKSALPTLKEWLLADHPRFDDLPISPRGRLKHRKPIRFED